MAHRIRPTNFGKFLIKREAKPQKKHPGTGKVGSDFCWGRKMAVGRAVNTLGRAKPEKSCSCRDVRFVLRLTRIASFPPCM